MTEKRGHKRFPARDIAVDCWMRLGNRVTVIDLCVSGISLQGKMRFELGRQYAMRLECEDEILSVKGTVIWSILSSTTEKFSGDFVPVYRAGFKFADTPLDNLQELMEVISTRKQRYPKLDLCKAVKRIPSLKKHHGDSVQKAKKDMAATTFDKRIHLVF